MIQRGEKIILSTAKEPKRLKIDTLPLTPLGVCNNSRITDISDITTFIAILKNTVATGRHPESMNNFVHVHPTFGCFLSSVNPLRNSDV